MNRKAIFVWFGLVLLIAVAVATIVYEVEKAPTEQFAIAAKNFDALMLIYTRDVYLNNGKVSAYDVQQLKDNVEHQLYLMNSLKSQFPTSSTKYQELIMKFESSLASSNLGDIWSSASQIMKMRDDMVKRL